MSSLWPPAGAADERLYLLYEISKLLTRFEGVEKTLPEVVAIASRALPVRTAVLVVDGSEGVKSYAWKTDDVDRQRLSSALGRARRTHAYLSGVGARGDLGADDDAPPASVERLPPVVRDERVAAASPPFIVLPLVVERHRVFGALQFEGTSSLDEDDLVFINAVANQVAVAIERQLRTDEARASAQRAREAAERGEERVRAQLDLTRALTGSIAEGIVAVDAECRVTFMNPAAEELLGLAEADGLGRFAVDVVHVQREDGSRVDDDDNPLVAALRSGRSRRVEDHSLVGRDAVAVPFSYTSSPMRAQGRVVGAVLAFRDVLAVKRSEKMQRFLAGLSAALGASLDHRTTLDALVRCSVPAFADMCLIDEDGPAPALGEAPGSPASGRPHASALVAHVVATKRALLIADLGGDAGDPPSRGGRSAILAPLRLHGRTLGMLTFVLAGSGRRYTPDDVPFADEIAHRAATAIDNARRHQQVEDAVRERQDILAMVSHDLRTPLNTVLFAASALLDRPSDPERAVADRRKLEMISRAAKRMVRMTSDLLDVASVEAGRLSVQVERTDLRALLREALESEQAIAARRALTIVAAPFDEAIEVRCDRDRIQQVLDNYLGNAIKFTPPGGRIRVTASVAGPRACVEVTDTGAGIDAELVPRLFERYRQAADTAARGRGLGLFISKGIIEAHGGEVGVTSRRGEGSTFFFTLPLADADRPDTLTAPETAARGR